MSQDTYELIKFMTTNPDKAVLKKMVSYFSEKRYLHPRELKRFWDSLTSDEKIYWRWYFRTM